jgi:hypothetical protein
MIPSHFFSEALLPVSDPKMQRDPVPHLVRSLDLGLVIGVAEGANASPDTRNTSHAWEQAPSKDWPQDGYLDR